MYFILIIPENGTKYKSITSIVLLEILCTVHNFTVTIVTLCELGDLCGPTPSQLWLIPVSSLLNAFPARTPHK